MRRSTDPEAEAATIVGQLRRKMGQMVAGARDVATLFCGGGKVPTPAAVRWLERLAAANYVNRTTFHEDPREQARREGRRELALEIIASVKLDPLRLERLSEQLREIEE